MSNPNNLAGMTWKGHMHNPMFEYYPNKLPVDSDRHLFPIRRAGLSC